MQKFALADREPAVERDLILTECLGRDGLQSLERVFSTDEN